MANPDPPPIVLTKNIAVLDPDGYTVIGTNVSTPLGSFCVIKFRITAGGVPCDYVGGFAQERIRNQVLYFHVGPSQPQPDSGWVPTGPQDPLADRFYLDLADIIDKKYYDYDPKAGYMTMLNGATLQTLDQDMRIKFSYPNSVVRIVDLPSTSFTYKKTGPGSYEIE